MSDLCTALRDENEHCKSMLGDFSAATDQMQTEHNELQALLANPNPNPDSNPNPNPNFLCLS